MEIPILELQNDMIKLPTEGCLENSVNIITGKILIINSTLRSFITLQVRKMTPKLQQMLHVSCV